MIIGDKIPWTPVVRLHARVLLTVLVVSSAVAAVHQFLAFKPVVAPLPFSVVGVALSIFLAFRNNAAYDRYWEARKLWGGLVNASRSFGRQVTTLPTAEPAAAAALQTAQRALVYRQIAYVHALRAALRGDDVGEEHATLLTRAERETLAPFENTCVGLLHAQGRALAAAAAHGWLSDRRHLAIDATLTELTALQGGCERIKRTPIPLAYRFFSQAFVRVFVTLLPFALVEQLGPFTIVARPAALPCCDGHAGQHGDALRPARVSADGLPLGPVLGGRLNE